MPPTVLHLSTYDANGGAARGAYALHRALLGQGFDSSMRVARKATDDPTVHGLTGTGDLRFRLAQRTDRQIWRLQRSPTRSWRSPARVGSLSADEINSSSADVVNLHWVTNGFLSIAEIGRISKPIVWSLYDMWPFAGTEHYGNDGPAARWRAGYTRHNRPSDESGVDIDRRAWESKRRHWTRPMSIVAASTWLRDCAATSALFRDWPVAQVPHVIDCEAFRPGDMAAARAALGLPQDRPLVLFLSSAGIGDRRKGWDLLDTALVRVRRHHPTVEVVVVGSPASDQGTTSGAPIHWHAAVNGDNALATLYRAASVTAVPSREDNMPLTAMEAQSSGRPVVAFRIGGLPDIVAHHQTGFLAEPFDTDGLADGLIQAIDDSLHDGAWATAARRRAMSTWSSEQVVTRFADIYRQALA